MRSKKRRRLHRYLSLLLVMVLVISAVSSGWAREAAGGTATAESEKAVPETPVAATEAEAVSEEEASPETTGESKTRFTYEDKTVKITAVVQKEANLPQNAVLRAKPVKAGTKAYKEAVAKVEEACELQKNETMECIPYDIYFLVNGHRVEPEAGTVKVSIQFVEPVLGENPGRVAETGVAHIKEDGEVEQLDGKVKLNGSREIQKVDFTTGSFSVFAPYTITTTSQASRSAERDSNLNNFIEDAVINGAQYDSNGKLILQNGATYGFKLQFKENSERLFDKTSELVYTVPYQLVPAATSGTFDMVIKSDGQTYTMKDNTYHMEGDKIKVNFNREDARFADFNNMANAQFWLEFDATVNASASGNALDFGASVEQQVTFNQDAKVTVNKTGTYDKANGVFKYQIDVVSVGNNTNVVVTDEITGSLLKYNYDVNAKSNKKSANAAIGTVSAQTDKGFTYTILSMEHGETITLSYTAEIDYGHLNGNKFKEGQTENTVKVTGNHVPESEKKQSFTNQIAYNDGVTKLAYPRKIEDGKQVIDWFVIINQDAKVYMGGNLVMDAIKQNPRIPMEYTGTGITVSKYTADNTDCDPEIILWTQLNSFEKNTAWTYKLPEDPGRTPYRYLIQYQTEADVSNAIEGGNCNVTNEVSCQGKSSKNVSAPVSAPAGNEFKVSKIYTSASQTEVQWEVNVTIPECGFKDSFTVTDDLPDVWHNNTHYKDTYQSGTLVLTMDGEEVSQELYTVKPGDGNFTVQFDFTKQATKTLFAKSNAKRTLKMTYITTPAPGWPENENHTNTVKVNGDKIERSDGATFKLGNMSLEKKYNASKTIDNLPAYQFDVYLKNVNSETATVTDTFDPSLFEVNTKYENSWDIWDYMTVGAGDQPWEASNDANGKSEGGEVSYESSASGGTFTLTNLRKKEGGAFYGYYCLRYCLKVKNAEAFEKIKQLAANSKSHKYTLQNVASWEDTGESGTSACDSATASYEVQPLSKSITSGASVNNNYVAAYKVEINKDKLILNGGSPITVTDTMQSHMKLQTDTMEVKVDGQPYTDYTYDFPTDKTSFTLTVPDGKHIEITYQVKIIGSGTVKYKNNVKITGNYSKSTGDQQVQINSKGGGTASEIVIRVIKRDLDDKRKTLAGAEFELYKVINGQESVVKDKTGKEVVFTTDAKGAFTIRGGQDKGFYLVDGDKYCLKEIEAPKGYLKAEDYHFTVKDVATAEGEVDDGYTIDIFDIDESKTIDIGGTKTWVGDGGHEDKRPESITIRVMNGNRQVGDPVTVTAENEWKWSVKGLPKYDSTGKEIAYRITEEPVNYYDSDVKGYNIINTFNPEKVPETVTVSGTKTWDDGNNQDGQRPDEITIHLMKKGKDNAPDQLVRSEIIKPDANGNWSWNFTDLPEYEKGSRVEYFIEEVNVPKGYTSTVNGYDVTNSYTPEEISVSGTKTWDDNNNQDGTRPDSITLHLMKQKVGSSEKAEVKSLVVKPENGSWSWSFGNLPKYENGKELKYTVAEDPVPGYDVKYEEKDDANGRVIDITNTEVITVIGHKTWDDNNNQDGFRPEEITIRLMKQTEGSSEKIEVNSLVVKPDAKGNWSWNFGNRPQYESRKKITYSIEEDPVGDYSTTIDGYNVTNSYTPGKTSVSGSKTWNDGDNRDGKRPSEITIRLMKKGKNYAPDQLVRSETIKPDAKGNWSWNFTDLPEYEKGSRVEYFIEEVNVPKGYTSTVNGYDVTNSYTPETVTVEGEKKWDDQNNHDGLRPKEITVRLLKNGRITGEPQIVSEEKGWKFSFTNLPKYENGKKITYAVEEVNVPDGYTSRVDGYNITNKHEPTFISVSGRKTWVDGNNQDGKRPKKITVQLLENDQETGKSQTVSEENNWSWSFDNLPEYKNGQKIKYSVKEKQVPDGYTSEVNGYNITNIHTPETVTVEGSKTWDDGNNQDGIRPKEITIRVMAGTEQVREATVTEADGWKWSFDNLPKYKGGVPIAYTIAEDRVDGYSSQVNGYDVTNTHRPETTTVKGHKTWEDNNNQDGKRPTEIKVKLFKDGVETGYEKTVTETNNWSWYFTELPKYEAGKEIVYTVVEAPVEGYKAEYTKKDNANGHVIDITNRHTPEKITVSGTKTWDDADNQDGIRPDKITIRLMKQTEGSSEKDEVDKRIVEPDENDNWSWSFGNLPKYENGKEIKYTVAEDPVEGYKAEYTKKDNANGHVIDITNTHTPEEITVSGTKTWVDDENRDNIRPGSIVIHLLENGEDTQQYRVASEENNWSYRFDKLPKYKAGKEITYTVKEDPVEGYVVKYEEKDDANGHVIDITNTHTPEKITVSGTKTWDDADNQDGKRPDSITIRLWDGAEQVGEAAVTAQNGWKWSFENLPKNKDGVPITYKVTEDVVNGYSQVITGYDVTNSYTPGTTSVTGSKIWDDGENQDGTRPDSITVLLKKNGETFKTLTVTEANNWSYTFSGLPEYEGGNKIQYTVEEQKVPTGYEVTYPLGTHNIINTHNPEKVDVEGTKTWEDGKNQDGIRPETVTVQLMKNGQPTGDYRMASKANNWSYRFAGLAKYENGTPITYSVEEVNVPDGYKAEYTKNGYVTNITNTHNPETVDISGSKTWQDGDDQDGIRPDHIVIRLMKGETKVASQTVRADGNWSYIFKDLPKYEAGEEVAYTVVEEPVAGYETAYATNGYVTNITNTHKTETVDISGSKTWKDGNNQDGIRPANIVIKLMKGEAEVSRQTVAAGTDGNWSYTFKNLPKYEAGREIAYHVEEEAVPGYEADYPEGTFDVVNTHEPETVNINGAKTWKDNNNQDGIRPANIVIKLMKGKTEVTRQTISADAKGNWLWMFWGLPKYEAGKEIKYSVEEEAVPGYEADYPKGTFDVVNTHTPETVDVQGTKTWADGGNQDGKRPNKITIHLLKNGESIETREIKEKDHWKWSFKALPKYENGVEITYSIREEPVAGYSTAYNGYDVTNTYTPGRTSVSGVKVWDDGGDRDGRRPAEITIRLLKNGEPAAEKTVTAADNWSYSFTDLPEYEAQKKIVYTVQEAGVPEGYTSKVSGYDVINTHEPETVEISGNKVWKDEDNQDGIRPESVLIRLMKGETEVSRRNVMSDADGNWSYTFTGLPKYEAGREIKYSVKEEAVPGYETTYPEGTFNVVNTHTPETVSVSGSKTWKDNDNRSEHRPKEITIHLLKNGRVSDTRIITEDMGWSWSFDNLPKYENGEEITYSIYEVPEEGYLSEISGYDVTNTITSVPIRKVDIGTGAPLAGAHLQILDAAGTVVADWTTTTEDFVVEGLAVDTAYTIHEVSAPEGYEVAADMVFRLASDGTVDKARSFVTCEDGVILVEDRLERTKDTSATIVKTISNGGVHLIPVDVSFYVALYYDEACTKLATPYKKITLQNTSSAEATFHNLEAGRTYYAGECDADGNVIYSGELKTGFTYHAKFTGTNGNRVVTTEGKNVRIALDNQMEELPDGFYLEGELQVTKKLVSADGKPVNANEIFYAGIFDDPGFTKLSESVGSNILVLDLAGQSQADNVTSVTIPSADSTVTLYVTEVEEDGTPVDGAAGFEYQVSVDGGTAVFTAENTEANVTITNQIEGEIQEETESTESSESSESEETTGSDRSADGSSRTSDNTPVLPMAILFTVSALGAAWILIRRRDRG